MTGLSRREIVLLALLAALAAAFVFFVVSDDGDGGRESFGATSTTSTPTASSTTQVGTAPPPASEGATFSAVKARGRLICGIGNAPGFAEGEEGSERGFDVDFCRAVAVAVLGDRDRVEFVRVESANRISCVQQGCVDVLIRTTTHTFNRDAADEVAYGPVTFYDGQRFMGRFGPFNVDSTYSSLEFSAVCVAGKQTTSYKNLVRLNEELSLSLEIKAYEEGAAFAISRFLADECDVVTGDGHRLITERGSQAFPDDYVVFERTPFSKEPLAPVFREGDDNWRDVVSWVVFATIAADEVGLTQAEAQDQLRRVTGGEAPSRSLGVCHGSDVIALGLGDEWALLRVIAEVGNYGEIFTNNLADLGISREGSLNALWSDGGLIFAPPC